MGCEFLCVTYFKAMIEAATIVNLDFDVLQIQLK